MPISKLTMLLEAQTNPTGTLVGSRVGGWSESWYLPFGATASALNLFTPLCVARARLLASSARIVGQRIQQVDPSVGASQVSARVFPGQSGLATDVPQMAVLVKIGTNEGANIRQWIMRGLPDARVATGEFEPSVAWTTAFEQFRQALNGYLFRGKDLAQPQAQINMIDATGDVFLENPLTLSAGDQVDIMKTIDDDGLFHGGRFQVKTVTNSTNFQLRGWPAVQVSGGKARKHLITFFNITTPSVVQGRVTVKKVGRPFSSYRGRRSKRR